MHKISTYTEYQDLLKHPGPRFLLKHSPTCGICTKAWEIIETVQDEYRIDNIYRFNVLHTDDLKFYIADQLCIKHESPQLILFNNGIVVDHVNHRCITKQWIINHLHSIV